MWHPSKLRDDPFLEDHPVWIVGVAIVNGQRFYASEAGTTRAWGAWKPGHDVLAPGKN